MAPVLGGTVFWLKENLENTQDLSHLGPWNPGKKNRNYENIPRQLPSCKTPRGNKNLIDRERKISPKFSCIKFFWDPSGHGRPHLQVKDVRTKNCFPALRAIGVKAFGPGRLPGYPPGRPRDSPPKTFMFRLLFRSWIERNSRTARLLLVTKSFPIFDFFGENSTRDLSLLSRSCWIQLDLPYLSRSWSDTPCFPHISRISEAQEFLDNRLLRRKNWHLFQKTPFCDPDNSKNGPIRYCTDCWLLLLGFLVAHDCGYPLSRYTCRATRVAADFLDFIAFCRCSTGVALHPLKILVSHLPPPVPGGVAPKFGSEKVSRYTGVSQLQLRVSRYTVQLSWDSTL